jgi:hypothetical protein
MIKRDTKKKKKNSILFISKAMLHNSIPSILQYASNITDSDDSKRRSSV